MGKLLYDSSSDGTAVAVAEALPPSPARPRRCSSSPGRPRTQPPPRPAGPPFGRLTTSSAAACSRSGTASSPGSRPARGATPPRTAISSHPTTGAPLSRHHALKTFFHSCLRTQDYNQQWPSQELVAKDLHDTEWKFRRIYRG
ncbi:hypothetical protein ZWY2020_025515 [Hordeum vulgare]|nr:hypothetical protein ZWY2020_025515 [Hordeum vulgare]